jgi:hypothetical protein
MTSEWRHCAIRYNISYISYRNRGPGLVRSISVYRPIFRASGRLNAFCHSIHRLHLRQKRLQCIQA